MRPAVRWICFAAAALLVWSGWRLFSSSGEPVRRPDDTSPAGTPDAERPVTVTTDPGSADPAAWMHGGQEPGEGIRKAPTPQQLAGEARRVELEQTLSRLQNSAVYIQGVDDPDADALARRPKRISLEPQKPAQPRR